MRSLTLALALVLALALALVLRADPTDAVVRLTSHGASGTVIATGPGSSLILTCAHCFPGQDRLKPIALDVPHPAPGAAQRPGVQLVALDAAADLALVRLGAGPLPYVAPVAPGGFRPGVCWSVGYDEMRVPPQKRPARISGGAGAWTHTHERPWHGRSGGGLIDRDSGQLVGVVSGYTGPRNRAELCPGSWGVYSSHASILRFLARHSASPPQLPIERYYRSVPTEPPPQPPALRPYYEPLAPSPWCPGGT